MTDRGVISFDTSQPALIPQPACIICAGKPDDLGTFRLYGGAIAYVLYHFYRDLDSGLRFYAWSVECNRTDQ
jgi:hypothetical protein